MTLLSNSHAESAAETVAVGTATTDTFVYVAADHALAQPLLEELEREYEARYGTFFGEPASAEIHRYPTSDFAAPHGAFVVLLRDGVPIAGGAFKRFDDHTAEFKRIWTSSAHRRQGLARRVVAELEAESQRRGYSRVYLTTGPRQPEAKSLYLDTGYTPLFDTTLTPEQVVIHGFAKTLDGRELDITSITAAHLDSLGSFHDEGAGHDNHDS